jgi:uncharacterized repeat protein (TIGR03803 family)
MIGLPHFGKSLAGGQHSAGAARVLMHPDAGSTANRRAAAVLAVLATAGLAPVAQAQTLTEYPMPASTNADLFGAPVQGRDGNLYGLTSDSNTTFYGTTPGGQISLLTVAIGINVACTTGMILGRDGNFYGTCGMVGGGTADVLFRFTPYLAGGTGTFTPVATIYTDTNGYTSNPNGLVQATDGNFYGSTDGGRDTPGFAFRVTPSGTVTRLHTFSGAGGPNFPSGALIQALDGKLYGNSLQGSTICCGNGTVYRMTLTGKISVLYNFATGNTNPIGPLTQGADGSFYGTSEYDGANGDGTIFKVTQAGAYTDLHDVNEATDGGVSPRFGLKLATDGNFYGTLSGCVPSGCGASGSFKVTAAGVFTPLFSFNPDCNTLPGNGGCIPTSGNMQHTNGTLFGVLEQGSQNLAGALYAETTNPLLKPGVSLQESSGAIGTLVDILGQGFSAATKVSFGKRAASFTVVSDTYLTATVPAAARTGYVTVSEPGAALQSQTKFVVK